MSTTPLVSVCVPTYNYGRFLNDCIESVLAQTFSEWELIVCDDCSTDNTAEIVQAFAQRDSRIRYFRNEQRLGMNANLKRVAEFGRARYLKMLCADDWLEPTCLEVCFELMEENPNVVLCTSAEILSTEAGEPMQVQFLFGSPFAVIPGETMLDRMAGGQGLGGNSSFFIRSSAYQAIGGYDTRCQYAADHDLAARLCRVGDYLHLDQPLFYGRAHQASSSLQDPKRLLDVIDWFEIPERVFRPRHFGNREWRRYQKLTAILTARYLVNTALETIRGNRVYARNLGALVLQHGNLLGIPWLVGHVPMRIYRILTGRNKPNSSAPPRNVGTPSALRRINSAIRLP